MNPIAAAEERIVSERMRRKLNEVNVAAQNHLSGIQDHVNFTLQVQKKKKTLLKSLQCRSPNPFQCFWRSGVLLFLVIFTFFFLGICPCFERLLKWGGCSKPTSNAPTSASTEEESKKRLITASSTAAFLFWMPTIWLRTKWLSFR